MKQKWLNWLSYSIFFVFLSCNKAQRDFEKKLEKLSYGKYLVVSEYNYLSMGSSDTFTQTGYGPFINNSSFLFRLEKIQESSINIVSVRDYNAKVTMDISGTPIPSPSYFDANYSIKEDYLEIIFNSADTLTGKIIFSRLP